MGKPHYSFVMYESSFGNSLYDILNEGQGEAGPARGGRVFHVDMQQFSAIGVFYDYCPKDKIRRPYLLSCVFFCHWMSRAHGIVLIIFWLASHQLAAFVPVVSFHSVDNKTAYALEERGRRGGSSVSLSLCNGMAYHQAMTKSENCSKECCQIMCQCPIGGGHALTAISYQLTHTAYYPPLHSVHTFVTSQPFLDSFYRPPIFG